MVLPVDPGVLLLVVGCSGSWIAPGVMVFTLMLWDASASLISVASIRVAALLVE